MLAALAALSLVGASAPRAPRPRVILVSVDGLWARDLQRAESAGVRLPVLDSLRRAGALAAGVIGSLPSVTYPSHTTMITGLPPARHGVYANRIFTPPPDSGERSYAQRAEIRVPTVFDAAHAAGLKVAAVFWPVSANDPSLDYNIPDAWDQTRQVSQLEALRSLGTPWLLDSLGAPAKGSPNDSLLVLWAQQILHRWNPDLLALHVLALDGAKHDNGIWNDSVVRVLRTLDGQLGALLAAVRATDAARQTTVIVTSDHGFLGYERVFRPGVLLANAGLVRLDSAGRVTAWDAGVLANGGSVSLLGRDTADPGLASRVRRAIPDSLVGPPPGRPIRAVWGRDTVAALGGDPRALWVLDLNDGFYSGGAYTGAVLNARRGGGHGYDPRRRELHAFFLISGPGVQPGTTRPLMRQTEVAGIVARILGLRGF